MRRRAPTSPATFASLRAATVPPTSLAVAANNPAIARPNIASPRPSDTSTAGAKTWSVDAPPPASARARDPPAAARNAWPDACINEPTVMASASFFPRRTASLVLAYRDREASAWITQMSVHPRTSRAQDLHGFSGARVPTDLGTMTACPSWGSTFPALWLVVKRLTDTLPFVKRCPAPGRLKKRLR